MSKFEQHQYALLTYFKERVMMDWHSEEGPQDGADTWQNAPEQMSASVGPLVRLNTTTALPLRFELIEHEAVRFGNTGIATYFRGNRIAQTDYPHEQAQQLLALASGTLPLGIHVREDGMEAVACVWALFPDSLIDTAQTLVEPWRQSLVSDDLESVDGVEEPSFTVVVLGEVRRRVRRFPNSLLEEASDLFRSILDGNSEDASLQDAVDELLRSL